jgi:hypothetical protein
MIDRTRTHRPWPSARRTAAAAAGLGMVLWAGHAWLDLSSSYGGENHSHAETVAPAALPPAPVDANRRISDYAPSAFWTHTFSSGGHNVAVFGSTIYAAWYDVRNGNSDVYVTKSTDGGQSWGTNVRTNDDRTTAVQYKPSIGVDAAGVLYMVWRDGRNGNADIYFAKSTDGGKSFTKNLRINDDRGVAYQGNPAIAVGRDGALYVVWSDNRSGNDDVYFTMSGNKGGSFSRNMKLNDDAPKGSQSHPTIAIDGNGRVFAAWEDFRNGQPDIYFTRSLDGGKSFGPNRRVNDDPGGTPQISPSITFAGGEQVLIAWSDFRNTTATLPPPSPATGEQYRWELARTGDSDIYYARSTDGGLTFSAGRKINDDAGPAAQAFPSLTATADGQVALAWEDFRHGESHVYMVKSADGGQTFTGNLRVNDDGPNEAGHFHPSVAVDANGRAYVIWTDERNNRFAAHGEEGNDVYFARLN